MQHHFFNKLNFDHVMGSVLGLTACSTMFGDNDRLVHVNSAPKGAHVTVNNQWFCRKKSVDAVKLTIINGLFD